MALSSVWYRIRGIYVRFGIGLDVLMSKCYELDDHILLCSKDKTFMKLESAESFPMLQDTLNT